MYHGSIKDDFWVTNLTAKQMKREEGKDCGTAVMYHGSIKDFWATKLTARKRREKRLERLRYCCDLSRQYQRFLGDKSERKKEKREEGKEKRG